MHASGEAPPIVIDVEASGFGIGSYPIEVGFALADRTTHCRLVKPCDDWLHWSEDAQAVHQVTRDQLFVSGWNVTDMAGWLNESFETATVYSDAWAHDMSWLGKLFDRANMSPTFRVESILTLLDSSQIDRWDATKSHVATLLDVKRHRASSDALIIQHTLVMLLE